MPVRRTPDVGWQEDLPSRDRLAAGLVRFGGNLLRAVDTHEEDAITVEEV